MNKLIPGIIFFGGLAAIVVFTELKQYQLRTYPHYTIGITTGAYWTLRSGKQIEYSYTVNNKSYEWHNRLGYDIKVMNGRYFVKYDTKDPSISKLLQDFPVPDSIKTAPPNGWKEPPVEKQVSW